MKNRFILGAMAGLMISIGGAPFATALGVYGPVMPADPAPIPAGGDMRDQATIACMTEAKNRAVELNATDITLRKVEDTDNKGDGVAAVRAEVNVITVKDGKSKSRAKTFKCESRNGVVTSFKWS